MEKTLAIIKPDGVGAGLSGEIIKRIESSGIRIVAMKMEYLDAHRAAGFYYLHAQKPFFKSLIEYMTSGPIILMVLQGVEVISKWRALMGPTDPAKAVRGTIRRDMGTDIERNVVHGSDSKDNAIYEVNYFFKGSEIFYK